jgi:cytochrome c-type biogenesis protein CcmE
VKVARWVLAAGILGACAALALVVSPRARLAVTSAWGRLRATPIAEVASLEDEREVNVVGSVGAAVETPFSSRSFFTLADGTGSVLVAWRGSAPDEGTRVLVAGKIERDLGPFRGLAEGPCLIEASRVSVLGW